MNIKLSAIAGAFLLATGLFGCKKDKDVGISSTEFHPITFKFGTDSITVSIDTAAKVVKNMPRGMDVTRLAAAAVLPAGYSISPNPATVADYTNGVTYTVNTDDGETYALKITIPVYDAVTNPYGVYTPKQLNEIRKGLNDSYVLMNDIELPALTDAGADITGISTYKTYGWYPVGQWYINGGYPAFRGTLDGQNHVIKNLTTLNYGNWGPPPGIDSGYGGRRGDGLFGYAVNATFKNIGIQLAPTGINYNDNGTFGVGALVGYVDSSIITNCYVSGTGAVVAGDYAGGLAGQIKNTKINKCYVALAPAEGYAVNGKTAGGLAADVQFSDVSECWSSSSVTGAGKQGGLLGAATSGTIQSCYATGDVVEASISDPYVHFPGNLGGLIGYTQYAVYTGNTIVRNCYATGAVTGGNGTRVEIHKSSYLGGLIGMAAARTIVTNCYAAGIVSRVYKPDTAPYQTGGLAGFTVDNVFFNNGTCTSYWDKTTTGQTMLGGFGSAENTFTANGKTTADMKTAATYTGWDFSSVWNIAGGANGGYPFLR